MRKTILYIAFTLDEVYECAYSILKYLEVYNMKPPTDHSLVIYTNYPDLLEAYGSIFHEFQLRPVPKDATKEKMVQAFSTEVNGKFLHIENNTYPINKFDDSFANDSQDYDQSITSYRDLKEFKILLRDFFGRYQEESITNQVKLLHNVDAKKIEKQKTEFDRLPLTHKWFRKITGKGWHISNYRVRI